MDETKEELRVEQLPAKQNKSIWKPDQSLMPIVVSETRSNFIDPKVVHQKQRGKQ